MNGISESLVSVEDEMRKNIIKKSVLIGILFAFIGIILTFLFQRQITKENKLKMDRIYHSLESETYETLQVQMGKLRVMEGHLIETEGDFKNFEPIAERMLNDGIVRSFLFAPGGVVKGVFPMEGNEPVYSLDMNTSGAGNLEAQSAVTKDTLILAGPFELVEGGEGICGRMPVHLTDDYGEKKYWGIVSVTLNYPQIFKNSSIDLINDEGFACRIWRVNPDDNSNQTILETNIGIKETSETVRYSADFFNTKWEFTLEPLVPIYKRKSLWLNLIGSILMGIIIGYEFYRTKKLKEMQDEASRLRILNLQQKLEQEESKQLLAQIRSHFFYHTLNTLQGLIIMKPEMAVKMVEDFARYLRFNVNTGVNADELVLFKDEIRATRAYAKINEAQLEGRLRVEFNIPDVNFMIPALTIEPIVENAILHGIKPKISGGSVRVSLYEDENFWFVNIEDDGVGFDIGKVDRAHSIGLQNVKKRMSHFEGCGINIESTIGSGTKVKMFFSKDGLKTKKLSM